MAHRILAVEYCPLDSFWFDPQNPRLHRKKQVRQIARSIETFGFNVPVLIDGRGQLIAGHDRVLAVTIKHEHLTETNIHAFMIADNRLAENSVWDERLSGEQFEELSVLDLNFNIDVTGFEMGEIEVMIEGLAPASHDKDDLVDAIPVCGKTSSHDKLCSLESQRPSSLLWRCSEIVSRWQEFTGLEAVHQGAGQTFAQREKETPNAQ